MSEHIPEIMQMAQAPRDEGKAPVARHDDDGETGSYFDAVRKLMHEIAQAVARLDVHIDWCTRNQADIKNELCGLKQDHKFIRKWALIAFITLVIMQITGAGILFRVALKHYFGISFIIDGV